MIETATPTLGEIDLLAACPDSELERLERVLGPPEPILEGATLCREGEPSDRFWFVIDGEADVTTDGRFVGSIGPGESVGEMGMLDGEPRVATVTAVMPMTTRSIARADFEQALEEAPALARAMLRQLSQRLRRLDRDHSAPAARTADAPVTGVTRPVPALPSPDYEINVFEPGYFDDPYSRYALVREHRPIYQSQASYSWIVSRYEDVAPLLRDRTLSHDLANAASNPVVDDERSRMVDGRFSRSMLRLDAPDHTRLRRLVSRVFTPKAISGWRARATTIVDGLLLELAEEDEFDLISRYAFPIPVQIISELLGMPMDSVAQLRAWSHAMTKTLDPINTPEEAMASMDAVEAMESFVLDVIAKKRGRPDEGLLSTLIEVEDDDQRMTERELLDTTMLLYVAGHETTVNLIGNGIAALLAHPDQMDLLRTDASLDANAVEELLRYDSPVQFARRITTEPIVVRDEKLPAGSVITLATGSANRDPLQWGPTADAVDVRRENANQHASFGGGPHHCLGAALARLEGQVAIGRLVRRFGRIAPAYNEPHYEARMILRGIAELPVRPRG
jgi:cytochrome P450